MAELTVYTSQRQIVLDALDTQGVYRVKKAYINAKYGESAWVFSQAYSFFRENGQKILPCPEGAESAVWLFHDARWCHPVEGSPLIRLSIPEELLIPFDLRLWNRVLNMEYIGKSPEEEEEFLTAIKRIGVKNTRQLFTSSFYPLQKRRVINSWLELFKQMDIPEIYLQYAVWELRREWIQEIIYMK